MGVGSFFYWLGYKHRKPRDIYYPDMTEHARLRTAFHEEYDERIRKFFEGHPEVVSWGTDSLSKATITFKAKSGFYHEIGRFVLDSDGEIERWESTERRGISLNRVNYTLSEEMLVSQIKGLLTDNEDASKYCEQVASTLLEDGSCIFNAPFGLHLKDKEFAARYHSKEWLNAWELALTEEFQSKEVCRDEKAGIGCFRLQAI